MGWLPDPRVSDWVKPMAASGEEIREQVEHDTVIFISLTSFQWATVTVLFLAVYSNFLCLFMERDGNDTAVSFCHPSVVSLSYPFVYPHANSALVMFSVILFQGAICFLL